MKLEIKNNKLIAYAESLSENKKILSLLEENSQSVNQTRTDTLSPKKRKMKMKRQVASEATKCTYCGRSCKGLMGKATHERQCHKNPTNQPEIILNDQVNTTYNESISDRTNFLGG